VTEPDLLVLEEPTRGIDPTRRAEIAWLADAGEGRVLVATDDRTFQVDRCIAPGSEVLVGV
jgi:ABC-type Mn2+/Zn2+ transport system ATPase subunit